MQTVIEKMAITYTLLTTAHCQDCTTSGAADLKELLDAILERKINDFSAEAVHAAQILMWNAARECRSEARYEWYELLQHQLFQKSTHLNRAKIGR